jgi:hypothetical protein
VIASLIAKFTEARGRDELNPGLVQGVIWLCRPVVTAAMVAGPDAGGPLFKLVAVQLSHSVLY